MAKFCIYCGEPLEESSRFCPACGKQVDSRPVAASQGNNTPRGNRKQDTSQGYAPQGPSWKDMKPKITIGKPQIRFISKGKLILMAIVFVIILVLSLLTK